MLKVKKIHKSYKTRNILSNISFDIEIGHKIALVGENGVGKSTLLKIIAGIESPDKGSVEVQKKVLVGYLPQEVDFTAEETILDYLKRTTGIDKLEDKINILSSDKETIDKYKRLGGYSFKHKAEIILKGFGMGDVSLEEKVATLSGGQKSKVVLAGVLLKGVDLLLLDEPTNNLDIPALIWLESFLKKSKGACIAVSHDRRFLDETMNKVFELDERTRALNISGGTYGNYLVMKEKEAARLRLEYRMQQEELKRLRNLAITKREDAARGAKWVGTDNDKFLRGFKRNRSGKSLKTAKVVERRIGRIERIERPFDKNIFEIEIKADDGMGTSDIKLNNIEAGYAEKGFKIGPISLDIRYGSKLGIMGNNGAGKSTLLKIIMGEIKPFSGEIEVGAGVKIGNITQEHENLPTEQTLLEYFRKRSDMGEPEAFSILSKFGFSADQVNEKISILSPGEKSRLLFAVFSTLSINTLILDEPTNHLDVESLTAMEEMLRIYKGTIILVSHDRYFVEKIKLDKIYLVENGQIASIPDYQEYIKEAEERSKKLLKHMLKFNYV